ncbi:hypothetical protein FRC11_013555, partial [Ceratobasidium sp. 423]
IRAEWHSVRAQSRAVRGSRARRHSRTLTLQHILHISSPVALSTSPEIVPSVDAGGDVGMREEVQLSVGRDIEQA